MSNVSPVSRANNTSSSSLKYSVPSRRVEGRTLSVVFLLEAVLIVAGNFLTIALFAKEKKLPKKSLFLVVNMAFADLISGAVSLPLYVYTSIGPSYRLWKTSYKALDIGWDVSDTTFSQASLISAVFFSLWTFLRHLLAAKTPNFVNQSVLHYNCHHLDAGFAYFDGVQPCQVLNFRQRSYVCLDVIPFAVSIYGLCL